MVSGDGTPARWKLTIIWEPQKPGIAGFDEIAGPIQAYLGWLARSGMQIVVVPDVIGDLPVMRPEE